MKLNEQHLIQPFKNQLIPTSILNTTAIAIHTCAYIPLPPTLFPTLRRRISGMASGGGRVKVNSILSVVSSKPIVPGRTHKLPNMGPELGLRRVRVIFYYESNPFSSGPMSDQLDNLRVSLSQLLNDYPVVTGRLISDPDDGGWRIKCNDAGVRMLQAAVGATLEEWLRTADAEEEQYLTVWEDMPQDPSFWSPFRIQISNFECGGLAIGLSCPLMQADITSAILLIKSWADVHRGQPLHHRPLFHLHAPLPPPTHFAPPPSHQEDNPVLHQKLKTLTMKFSAQSVQKCLSQAQKQSPSATPFDVLTALLWSRIAALQESTAFEKSGGKRFLSICTDLRNREHHDQPVPTGYFGTALRFSSLCIVASDLAGGGIGKVADSIHRHVEGLKESGGGGGGGDSWEAGSDDDVLTCVNMEHMVDAEKGESLMYAAVFDEGKKPVHVTYDVEKMGGHYGVIIVAPAREAGPGRNVTVTLPEGLVGKLGEDEEILELEPSMVLAGSVVLPS